MTIFFPKGKRKVEISSQKIKYQLKSTYFLYLLKKNQNCSENLILNRFLCLKIKKIDKISTSQKPNSHPHLFFTTKNKKLKLSKDSASCKLNFKQIFMLETKFSHVISK